ncbi:uncharacterized protein LOC134291907 [Aedes albopictus]|uniref:Integrase catalytic domain-containing protein n=1 Tax=Aedes albopictus TaxID=7160 RepID=A0ABM1YCW1_AEDAL
MGVDYFGPMLVTVGRRTEKRWGVLATCLTIRAIHLELAHTLTTDSCILALRNIMARRGTPAIIFSDRGTNFQGASKELKDIMQNIDQERLMEEFTTPNTEWSFIPPASPHMGGAWERLIRSVKSNLRKLQWRRLPTDEVLNSTLIEIESVVNSRPLTEIPIEDDESPVLTPNHFLLGTSNGLKPWVPYSDSPSLLRNSFKQSQIMANEFWRMWLRDYLPVITRRAKWFTKEEPIQVNDVVVIVDPKAPRNSWPLGRVIATRPSSDGQSYAAILKKAQEDPELKELGENVVRTKRTLQGDMLFELKKDPAIKSSAYQEQFAKSLGDLIRDGGNVEALCNDRMPIPGGDHNSGGAWS